MYNNSWLTPMCFVWTGRLEQTGDLFFAFVDLCIRTNFVGVGRGSKEPVSYTHLTLPTKRIV